MFGRKRLFKDTVYFLDKIAYNIFNEGVFLDSPGVKGNLISVPQRICVNKAKLN